MRRSPASLLPVDSAYQELSREALLQHRVRLAAFFVAWFATCGSLFFSEVLRWQPCTLCWYQRILMYPLSLVLAIGTLRHDRSLPGYALPFAILGISVSLYHYLLQKTDWLPPPPCAPGVSCAVDYINWFGFVTIPFLALVGFMLITLCLVFVVLLSAGHDTEHDHPLDASVSDMPEARAGVCLVIGSVILLYVFLAYRLT